MNEKTRLTISIPENARANVPLVFRQRIAHGVWVDWGDGDYPETFEQEGIVRAEHAYSEPGTYIIEMYTVDDCVLELGGGSPDTGLFGESDGYRQMLISAEIGKDVSYISRYAFRRCGNMETISLPEELHAIGEYAFDGCCSLQSVQIPGGIALIRSGTFFGCTALESITLPAGVVLIGNYAFYNCCALEQIELSNTEEIGRCAFQYCRKLQTAALPSSLRTIGSHAFEGCVALREITVPDGVTTVQERSFASCRSASKVTLSPNIKKIAAGAFENCAFAKEVIVLGNQPPVLACPSAFDGLAADCVIHIPDNVKESYENATNWIVYKTRMEVTV